MSLLLGFVVTVISSKWFWLHVGCVVGLVLWKKGSFRFFKRPPKPTEESINLTRDLNEVDFLKKYQQEKLESQKIANEINRLILEEERGKLKEGDKK